MYKRQEIDRVSETTKFNETYLLKGQNGTTDKYMKAHEMCIRDRRGGLSGLKYYQLFRFHF